MENLLPTASPAERRQPRCAGRIVFQVVIYLAGFCILLMVVSRYYLIPAIEATRNASHEQRRALSASATLVLAVVLFVMLAGWLVTFRIGRFFRPPIVKRGKPTDYVDAWEESARRLKMPPEEEES